MTIASGPQYFSLLYMIDRKLVLLHGTIGTLATKSHEIVVLDHLLEHHVSQGLFAMVLASDTFRIGGLAFIYALHKHVDHLDIVVISDCLFLPLRCNAAAARLLILLHYRIALLVTAMSCICSAEECLAILNRLFIVDFNIIVFDRDDTLAQKVIGFHNHINTNLLDTVDLGNGFRETNHTLQLTHGDSIRVLSNASLGVISPKLLVLLHENFLGLISKLGSESLGEADVSLELFCAELGLHGLIAQLVDTDNVLCQVTVNLLIALI
ncbi:hypothetical protein HG531_007290 [Fusarium graminearum]|nr:hypothetical protein HG531_007290 [Fusarium graminearum]